MIVCDQRRYGRERIVQSWGPYDWEGSSEQLDAERLTAAWTMAVSSDGSGGGAEGGPGQAGQTFGGLIFGEIDADFSQFKNLIHKKPR